MMTMMRISHYNRYQFQWGTLSSLRLQQGTVYLRLLPNHHQMIVHLLDILPRGEIHRCEKLLVPELNPPEEQHAFV
jgi:hypothetical protein